VVKQTDKKPRVGDGTPGPGRPKGIPNKNTQALKDMILGALDKKGGVDYLMKQADENPTAFLTLVGKVLPLTVNGDPTAPLTLNVVTGVPRND
jgi:hypothetical protein